jgi:uncharacterized membrane protein
MTSTPRPLTLLALSLAAVCALPMCQSTKPPLTPGAEAQRLFTDHVKPILQQHCLRCHSGANPGLMDLSNSAAAFLPQPGGRAYIVPGKPDQSLIIEAISRDGLHQRTMPRLLVTLTDMEIGTLREWITAGAPWPTGPAGNLRHTPSAEHP